MSLLLKFKQLMHNRSANIRLSTVCFVGAAAVFLRVVLLKSKSAADWQTVTLGRLRLNLVTKHLQVLDNNGQPSINIYVGETLGTFQSMQRLSGTTSEVHMSFDAKDQANQGNTSHMILTKEDSLPSENVDVYAVKWHAPNRHWLTLEDRIDMTGAHWYGGAETYYQHWPLEQCQLGMHPYVVNDIFATPYGDIQERLWFSTKRIGIYVPKDVPLWVEVNSKGSRSLKLRAQHNYSIYSNFNSEGRAVWLEYKLIVAHNSDRSKSLSLRRFNRVLLERFFDKPSETPDERMIMQPIWSTWAKYKKPINQSCVLDFARQIVKHKFSYSQLEIDDEWATHYGDLKFDPKKFPHVHEMTSELQRMGFRITLWIHPFATTESAVVNSQDNYWMRDANDRLINSIWWGSNSSRVMDVTSDTTVDWYVQRLELFRKKMDIDSYKFDAGELNYLGPSVSYASGSNPNYYAKRYAEMGAKLGNLTEIRVGTGTQQLPVFVRLLDRHSKWGLDNGLHSMITAILTVGTIGYAYIMPDMVGGNDTPDRELYVRWVQASVFLPTVQFSIAPWDFDHQVVTISRNMMRLREQYKKQIMDAMRSVIETGEPVIRPLWFIDESEEAFTCNSQFLLGDTIMVAPVLKPNVSKWSVYIPKGNWKSQVTHQMHTGPIRIEETVTLATLPYYTKLEM